MLDGSIALIDINDIITIGMVITDSNLVHNHLGFKHDEVLIAQLHRRDSATQIRIEMITINDRTEGRVLKSSRTLIHIHGFFDCKTQDIDNIGTCGIFEE